MAAQRGEKARPRLSVAVIVAVPTLTGTLDVRAPKLEEIDIASIARSLARTTRWNGLSSKPLSVAEHSVMVSICVDPRYEREGLLHDAAEAYLGDSIRPVKYMPGMQAYRRCEERVERAVAERFDLVYPWPEAVKVADERILVTEIRQLMPVREYTHTSRRRPLDITIECWSHGPRGEGVSQAGRRARLAVNVLAFFVGPTGTIRT
jgi:hypothetical protein